MQDLVRQEFRTHFCHWSIADWASKNQVDLAVQDVLLLQSSVSRGVVVATTPHDI